MTIDAPRLRRELEFITNHPERWSQGRWAYRRADCGTVGCLAGTVVLHAGFELVWNPDNPFSADPRHGASANHVVDGRSIHDVAAELLGLDPAESLALFDGANALRDLWELAARLTNGEVAAPPNLPAWADRRAVDPDEVG